MGNQAQLAYAQQYGMMPQTHAAYNPASYQQYGQPTQQFYLPQQQYFPQPQMMPAASLAVK